MSTAFESIQQALQEAIRHAQGNDPGTRVHYPRRVDVREVRTRMGLTQKPCPVAPC